MRKYALLPCFDVGEICFDVGEIYFDEDEICTIVVF